jgi:general secretion pathway protein A
VTEGKTVVLVIDEGQKLSLESLENLRVLLNYETNEYKLLQVAIFSQMELLPRIKRIKNFLDRVALKYIINPLDEQETAQMIRFRLEQAGLADGRPLFSPEAIQAVYRLTQGYPRKIAMLCHNALEALVMREQPVIEEALIQELVSGESRWIPE